MCLMGIGSGPRRSGMQMASRHAGSSQRIEATMHTDPSRGVVVRACARHLPSASIRRFSANFSRLALVPATNMPDSKIKFVACARLLACVEMR